MITGASGFLGKSIVAEFAGDEFEVFTTSRGQHAESVAGKHFQVDLTDLESVRKLEKLPKIDVLIHAAGLAHRFGRTAEEFFRRVNVVGTENAVRLAARIGVGHFVYISTVAVYGNPNPAARNLPPVNESNVCAPVSRYAVSKYEAEQAAREICRKHGVDLTVLRPSTIVGEDDPGNLLRLIRLIDKNRFVWVGAGENLKSLVYKADAAQACRRVAVGSAFGADRVNVYNVTAETVRMRQIVEEIARLLERKIPTVSINERLAAAALKRAERLTGWLKFKQLSETVDKWISEENFSGEKLRNDLKFVPQTAVLEAVARETNFYKAAVRNLSR